MRTLMIFLMMTTAAAAQNHKASPEALDACKKQSAAFTDIAKCLPAADVSVSVLAAFAGIFPPAALPLKTKCLELNADNLTGAAACVQNAIEDAVKLKASMPDGSDLDDPVFTAISKQQLYDQLEAVEKKARQKYPHQSLWGVTMYHPYR